MEKHLAAFTKRQSSNPIFSSILQFVATVISVVVLLFLATTVIFFQWDQMSRTSLPASAASPTNSTSQGDQILSEAQQDVSVATDVIAWSGFFLAFIASSVAIAGFFGIHEFRRIQHLRHEIDKDRQEIDKDRQEVQALKAQVRQELDQVEKHFKSESQTFLEVTYNQGAGDDAYRRGDNKLAIGYYLNVLKRRPDDKRTMERLGRAYSNLNEMQTSIDYLQQALKNDPSYVPALRSLGLCYRYTDKNKAIEQFKLALEKDPNDYEALDFLGLVYRDNGLISEAIAAHEQALKIKRRPETQFFLSLLYAKRGGKDDRNRALRMALNAEDDLDVKDPNEEMRPVWQLIIRAGARILQGNEDEAYELVKQLKDHVTTQRTADALTGHLKFLLEATGHSAWIDKFTSTLIVK